MELFEQLNQKHRDFISDQHLFFVATAGAEGRVNVSPKGLDSLGVVDDNTIQWLNLTGSGNETAAHVLENQRMTLMFCSFDPSKFSNWVTRVQSQKLALHVRTLTMSIGIARGKTVHNIADFCVE